jgi:hypothetical protein
MALKSTICMTSKGSVHEWFMQNYPDYPDELQYLDSKLEELIAAVRRRDCEVAIVLRFEYDTAAANATMNPNCNLEIIGQPLQNVRGGWAVLNDYSDKCTVW